jgi:hypothetical protein
MTIAIKNWHHFQHFKDRRPPWIKLYREILDDLEWSRLSGEHAKALVMLWLIASESDGILPPVKHIAFRLRKSETETIKALKALNHWLEQDDIGAISKRYQDDAPETEGEKETEKEKEERHRRACLFQNSDYFDFDKFKAALPEWDESTCREYWQSASDYSAAKGAKYIDWIAAVRNWHRKHSREGKTLMQTASKPADKPLEQWTMYELNSAIEAKQQALGGFPENATDPKNARHAEWKTLHDSAKRLKAERARRG